MRQTGTDNELRLSQTGDHHSAVLTQIGSNNQIAIYQTGSSADVSGTQNGIGNQLVLQQDSNSKFEFSQIGNQNQMLITLPAGQYLKVDQVGDFRSVTVNPGSR